MIRFKHILSAVAALALPSVLWAVPADPRPRTITNPDGSEVVVRVHGDERFHFMTDADCTTILQRNEKGFVEKMLRNGQPLAFTTENARMLFEEKQAASPAFTLPEASSSNGMARMATLNSEGRSNYPTIGDGIRSLVVLVEFQDVEFTVENPKEYYTRQLNEIGFSDFGACGSARDYFMDASHGLYAPQFDVYGPVKVSKDAAYFKDNSTGHMKLLIREALTQLHDEGELDLRLYDYDEDKVLDTVFLYYAGYGSADSETETIWPHQYDYRYFYNSGGINSKLTFDGIQVGPYACANELDGYNPTTNRYPYKDGSEAWVGGIATFVHEYGHVLGLPDLYDVEYTGGVVTPGKWDVMDQGSYNFHGTRPPLYSAYEQWVCRWLEFTDAEVGTHYDLEALGSSDAPNAVRVRIPKSASGASFESEYFIIEARDNSNWDRCFDESGLMFWRINYNRNVWIGNTVNSVNGSNVEIIYANGSNNPIFSSGALYEDGDAELKPSKNYTFWKSPVISDISYDNDLRVGSFDYNMVEPTTLTTLVHDKPAAAADGSRSFTLTWDPVDGVDSYLLTVRVKSTKRIIDECDEKNVGNVASYQVSNVTNMNWKQEVEAFVTCVVRGLKSSKISNVISFRPMDLEKGDPGAVDGIEEDDELVAGGVGCIVAPEGAEIYTMSGAKTSRNDIPAGIYLVSYRGKTTKVIVR